MPREAKLAGRAANVADSIGAAGAAGAVQDAHAVGAGGELDVAISGAPPSERYAIVGAPLLVRREPLDT